jgi:hypothetical protein
MQREKGWDDVMKQKNTVMKIKMYILSLWLLFIMVIVATVNILELSKPKIDWSKLLCDNTITISCLIFLIFCVIFFFEFRYKLQGTTQLPIEAIKVKNINSEYLAFLTTYIIPLVLVDFSSKRQITILVFILLVVGVIYVKTNMFYSNPTLALLGYRIYEVETNVDGICGTFISLDEIEDGQTVRYIRLDKNVFFVRRVSR